MPVIAASIVNKTGKILLSRQFMEITRIRIEGLLSAFPKLLGTGGAGSKQSTVLESGTVRYVYQPIESLYLVVVTTKNSNIVEDLATLRLMGRLVSELSPKIDEESISEKAFEILFAFDEVVTEGRRENVTLEQITTILDMHSLEEEQAAEDKKRAEDEAKRIAKARAKELKAKRNQKEDFFSDPGGNHNDDFPTSSQAPRPAYSDVAEAVAQPAKKPSGGGGMSLGNKFRRDQASKVLQESGGTATASAPAQKPQAQEAEEVSHAGVHIKIEEKVSIALNREGGINGAEIAGTLTLNVSDAESASCRVTLAPPAQGFAFKTHPNINKQFFNSDNILAIKEGKPYPCHQSLAILRWSSQQITKNQLPLSINCWPGDSSATVEFELENKALVLENVVISMPLCGAFPTVGELENGASFQHHPSESRLDWMIPRIDRYSESGTMDVSLNQAVGEEAFFPAVVRFQSQQTLSNVSVQSVTRTDNGRDVDYSCEVMMHAADYSVE